MKQNKLNQKKFKKPNIPLRRKMAIIYARFVLSIKLTLLIFLYLFFFTTYLNFIKYEIVQYVHEVTGDIGFKFENLLIEGQQNILSEDILTTLNADIGTPIFAIDINEVKRQLERNSWVKAAIVERRLPNTIYIALLERVPIAIWQNNHKLFLIDEDGFKITGNIIEKFAGLPHVVGVDANNYASKLIEDFSKAPNLLSRLSSAVRYGERRWNLNFEQNIVVKMPEVGFNKALDYLINLNKANKLFDQNYKIIDLRDATKYYIEKY